MKEKFGGPFWDTHRADLQMALYEKAQELGVEFQFGAKVTAYDFSKPTAILATGETVEGDLIVAADGKYLSKTPEYFQFHKLKTFNVSKVSGPSPGRLSLAILIRHFQLVIWRTASRSNTLE